MFVGLLGASLILNMRPGYSKWFLFAVVVALMLLGMRLVVRYAQRNEPPSPPTGRQ